MKPETVLRAINVDLVFQYYEVIVTSREATDELDMKISQRRT